nr:MAG TPA: hypothetical protein [Caudoviricetes sp.]
MISDKSNGQSLTRFGHRYVTLVLPAVTGSQTNKCIIFVLVSRPRSLIRAKK